MRVQTSRESSTSPPLSAEARAPRPIIGWAVVGALFLAVEAISIGGWILRGEATPTSTGADPVPTYTVVAIRLWEAAGIVGMAVMIYRLLYRPWRREGRLSTSGLFLIGAGLCYWQDPLLNYSQNWFSYNSAFVNLGSWTSSVPGALAPRSHLMPEPLLWAGSTYITGGMGWMVGLGVGYAPAPSPPAVDHTGCSCSAWRSGCCS